MKILNLIQCANLGGMEHSNLLRLRGLKQRGHKVKMISLHPIGDLGPLLEDAAIPAIGLAYAGRFGWHVGAAIRRILVDEAPDAVIVTGHNTIAMAALGLTRRVPRLLDIHYHHFENGQQTRPWRLFYWGALRIFDHITFCSDFIMQEALRIYSPLAAKAVLLPNPFQTRRPPSDDERRLARRHLGIPLQSTVIGNAGWLVPRKRFDVFLDVASLVARKRPECLFLIAGDGEERNSLQARAKALGIADQVRWLGWRQDLTSFYHSLDLLLFNTDFEAMGRTPPEAAAYGVPSVCSVRQGGLGEVFNSLNLAVLLNDHDVPCLATAVHDLLGDSVRRQTMGQAVRARVEAYGSPARHAEMMEWLLTGQAAARASAS